MVTPRGQSPYSYGKTSATDREVLAMNEQVLVEPLLPYNNNFIKLCPTCILNDDYQFLLKFE